MPSKRPIICLSTVDWDFLFQRHQQLMLRLAQAGHPVHYRNPGQVYGALPEEVSPHLWVYRDFDKRPAAGLDDAIFFVYFPAYAGGLAPNPRRFTIYDCTDDFPEFTEHEQLMVDRSDLVICCSEPLRRKFQGRHPHILYLPNGVDLRHFSTVRETPPEMEPIMAAGGPILGYTGALYTRRLDLGLLRFLAERRPQWRIALIGDTYGIDLSEAPQNLIFLGRRPHDMLPAYMRCFDLGLIPFLDNQIARGTDPIKLYEYIAAGLPVVSRALPFADNLAPPLVYTYDSYEGCLDTVDRALAERADHPEAADRMRVAFAAANSWDGRVCELLRTLDGMTWLEA